MQVSLDAKPNSEITIAENCCSACYLAQKKRCTCRCHGLYHGQGNPNFYVSRGDTIITHSDLTEFLKDKRCRWDKKDLSKTPVKGYPHSAGWTVGDKTYWLFVTCPKCGYDWALWKLGLPREATFN